MQVSSALELLRLSVKMENLADGSHGERISEGEKRSGRGRRKKRKKPARKAAGFWVTLRAVGLRLNRKRKVTGPG
jgi:hypothetical protein